MITGRLLTIGAFFAVIVTACTQSQTPSTSPPPSSTSPMPSDSGKQISLNTFTTPSPQPSSPPPSVSTPPATSPQPSSNLCIPDSGRPMSDQPGCVCDGAVQECAGITCVNTTLISSAHGPLSCFSNNRCPFNNPVGFGEYCIYKPVVYLYPESAQLVDVAVESVGEVVVSDPHYPKGGWRDVLAQPDGSLTYQGKPYTELFFETNVDTIHPPKTGITVKTAYLKPVLSLVITQLGLTGREHDEFLAFWVPKLTEMRSPYVYVSVLENEEKDRVDKLIVSPKPQTRIEFIAYFKPVNQPELPNNWVIPQAPKREGFTVVEWGGVIDDKRTTDKPFQLF